MQVPSMLRWTAAGGGSDVCAGGRCGNLRPTEVLLFLSRWCGTVQVLAFYGGQRREEDLTSTLLAAVVT